MYNETKTILKLAKNTKDENLKKFLEEQYLSEDDEKEEEQKEEKQEDKKEEKEETKKVEKSEDAYLKLFESMNDKITALTEKVEKSTPFGAKKKQGQGKETSEFDDIFTNLRSKQRS